MVEEFIPRTAERPFIRTRHQKGSTEHPFSGMNHPSTIDEWSA
jgi:hypothetical protein